MTTNDTDQNNLNDEVQIEDDLGDEEDRVVPVKYSISNYGADYDVFGLVRRLKGDDIVIPPFQREFIWSKRDSSRFIESLLLGLPVPGIFLSRDDESRQLLVIDGQQRLRSLLYFYEGIFGDSGKEFALVGVQEQFENKTYKTLPQEDRRQLDDSILHATIIKQDEPSDDNNTSMYYIFERLNTTGTPLTHQEIRATIYHKEFNLLLEQLNQNKAWRSIYGPVNKRRRDQEFILRFFALYYGYQSYSPPMKEFLNNCMRKNNRLKIHSADQLNKTFTRTIEIIFKCIGKQAFRPTNAFNAAVFDAVMVGVARRLEKGDITNCEIFKESYNSLLVDKAFLDAIETGTTASVSSVTNRIQEAIKAFQDVE